MHVLRKKAKVIIKNWSKDVKEELVNRILKLQEKLDTIDRNNVWGNEVNSCRLELAECIRYN